MGRLLNVHEVEGDTKRVLIEIDIELAISLLIGLGSMNSQYFVESARELGLTTEEAEHLDGVSSNDFTEMNSKLMHAYGKHIGRTINREHNPYVPQATYIEDDSDIWNIPF